MRLIFLLVFLLPLASIAGKTLDERVEDCLGIHEKTVKDAQNLASNLYALQKELHPSDDTPFEILEKDIDKVEKGVSKLYVKTEKTLDRYDYYTEELEFEVEDVFEAMDRTNEFLKKGVRNLDEAAFENYHENLKKAHEHFLSAIEHLILYKERMIGLKEILYKMMSKHQITF